MVALLLLATTASAQDLLVRNAAIGVKTEFLGVDTRAASAVQQAVAPDFDVAVAPMASQIGSGALRPAHRI